MRKIAEEEKQTIELELSNGMTISEIAEKMSLSISEIIAWRASDFEKKRPESEDAQRRYHLNELRTAMMSMKKKRNPPGINPGNKYIGIMKVLCERRYDGIESRNIRQHLRGQGETDGAEYGIKSLTGGELKTLMQEYLAYCCLSEPEKYFLNKHGRDLLEYLERSKKRQQPVEK